MDKPARLAYSIEVTTEMPQKLNYFEFLRMSPNEKGLIISAKSSLFAEWLNGLAVKTDTGAPSWTTNFPPWEGKFLRLPNRNWLPRTLGFISPTATQWFDGSGLPNLLWLTHKDLGKGFDLLVTQPIARNDLEDYFSSCCTAVQNLHQERFASGLLSAKFFVERLDA